MQQQDLEAKVKNSNFKGGRFGLCGLIALLFLAVGGCSSNEVQITGKVTEVRSQHIYGIASCSISLNSKGAEYELNIYEWSDVELCDRVLKESAGIQCCMEFRKEYGIVGLIDAKEPDKKKHPDAAARFEQCKGIRCEFSLTPRIDFDYLYTAYIDDVTKSPTITVTTNIKEIRDSENSKGQKMKEIAFYREADSRHYRDNPSQLSIQPSPYEAKRVMDLVHQSLKRCVEGFYHLRSMFSF